MKNQNLSATIVAQPASNKQSKGRSPQQLDLFAAPDTGLQLKAKPQISSIPGVSPKDSKRYRVKLGHKILGDRLCLDEALKIAKRGES
jgi:hypothetical protein